MSDAHDGTFTGYSSSESAVDCLLIWTSNLKHQSEDLKHEATLTETVKSSAHSPPCYRWPMELSVCPLWWWPVRYGWWDTKALTVTREPPSSQQKYRKEWNRSAGRESRSGDAALSEHMQCCSSSLSGAQCAGYISHRMFLPGQCFQQWPLNLNSEASWAGKARVNKNQLSVIDGVQLV